MKSRRKVDTKMAPNLLLPTVFVIMYILPVSSVTAISHNDVELIGCFKTGLVDSQLFDYKIEESLTWEKGMAACIHRNATHVGVQADNRTTSLYSFFCGNDLSEPSTKLVSACTPCEDPTNRHCGGPPTISLFKIREPPKLKSSSIFIILVVLASALICVVVVIIGVLYLLVREVSPGITAQTETSSVSNKTRFYDISRFLYNRRSMNCSSIENQ